MKTRTKRRNPVDLTLRNLRALKRRVAILEAQVEQLQTLVRQKARG